MIRATVVDQKSYYFNMIGFPDYFSRTKILVFVEYSNILDINTKNCLNY